VKGLGPVALVDDSRLDRGVARSDALPRDRARAWHSVGTRPAP